MATLPITTTRVSSALMRNTLAAQIQADNLDLFRLQTQISTGLRIFLPSDDASSAQRAMVLQRTLERKDQSITNVQGATSALKNAEGALDQVAEKLNQVSAQALSAAETVTTQSQRDTVIDLVDEALSVLVTAANSRYTDNYLFAGNETAFAPYVMNDTDGGVYIEFQGNQFSQQTFADIGILFDVSISGNEVFGGISTAIRGSEDLNPQLTRETKISQLNGGLGISPNGAISLTFDPAASGELTTTSTIEISNATTIDDLIRTIESNLPEGAQTRVEISGNALTVTTSNGDLSIGEVFEGTTAAELGINTGGISSASITGTDLNPTLLKTTPLGDLEGNKSRGTLELVGDNNDLLIESAVNGSSFDGLTIDVVDGATTGAEFATYDSGANTLTVTIAEGASTADAVASAINAEGTFVVTPDIRDATAKGTEGTGEFFVGTYDKGGTGLTGGGSNGSIDLASGVRITNGEGEVLIDTSSAETVEDLLNLFNRDQYGLRASINEAGTGIDIQSRRSGSDFTIGENGGSTASDLGIRTYTADSLLADFNHGLGVAVEEENQFIDNTLQIAVADFGVTTNYTIDTEGLTTVQDVIDEINSVTGGNVTASLATVGNGITLTGTTPAVAGTNSSGDFSLGVDTLTVTADAVGSAFDQAFTIEIVDSGSGGISTGVVGNAITVDLGGSSANTSDIATEISSSLPGYTVSSSGSAAVAGPIGPIAFSTTGGINNNPAGANSIEVSGGAGQRLGFFGPDETSASSATAQLTSTDNKPHEVDSVFNTLLRLRDALESNNTEAIAAERTTLDEDIDRVTLARAEIGTRVRNLESFKTRIEDEQVDLQSALSDEIDVDFVQAASDYALKQASMQASLQTSASLLQLSILDFI